MEPIFGYIFVMVKYKLRKAVCGEALTLSAPLTKAGELLFRPTSVSASRIATSNVERSQRTGTVFESCVEKSREK
jgi:hypothetical protein